MDTVSAMVKEPVQGARQDAEMRRLAAIIASSDDAILSTNLDMIITSWNQGATKLYGYSAQEAIGQPVTILVPLDRPKEEEAILARISQGERVDSHETRRLHKDGHVIEVSLTVSPIHDAKGRVVGASKIARDITQRRREEAERRRLAAIIESSQDAILSIDLEMRITTWNQGATQLYGYTAEEAVGQMVTLFVPPERWCEEEAIIARIKAGERIAPHETQRQHKDGRLIDVSLTVSPLHDEYGRIVGASKIARDITDRKEAERLQKFLLGEMKHRVKNILATVNAIARQTFRGEKSAATEAFAARIFALAQAQDVITRERRDGADLAQIIAEVIRPYQPEKFDLSGPEILLPARMSLAVSLGIHELATNAAKYGALGNEAGRVTIRWSVDQTKAEPWLQLCWQESGGARVTPPRRTGFGSLLIRDVLAAELNGKVQLRFYPTGVRCTVRAPLDFNPRQSE